jgi:hypothetical protein
MSAVYLGVRAVCIRRVAYEEIEEEEGWITLRLNE